MPNDSCPILGANTLSEVETDQLRSLIETWTDDLATGRIAEWKSYWAGEAVLMPPAHQRVSGLNDIVDYVTKAFSPGIRYRFSDWSFTGRDDIAVVANNIELNIDDTDDKPSQSFNQVIVLRRGADQSWRIQTVIFTPTG